MLIGVSESAQDISYKEMQDRTLALGEVLLSDPAISAYSASIGAGSGGQTGNNGRFFVSLKPFDERDVTAAQVIARLRPRLARVQGAALFLQAAQDIRVGGRISKTTYQYTLQDADADELYSFAPKVLAALQSIPQLRDLATDQQSGGSTATLTIDRDAAARFGIQPQVIDDTLYDAFGQRQITQYFTQVNSYHVVMEVPSRDRRPARHPGEAVREVGIRTGRAAVDLREGRHGEGGPAFDQSPEPVPGGDDLVQPRPRVPHSARRSGRDQHRDVPARGAGLAAGHLPGHRPGVPVARCRASPT